MTILRKSHCECLAFALHKDGNGGTLLYICHCNALTDRDVQKAIASGASRPCEVYGANGCKAQCGSCAPTMVNLLRSAMSKAAETFRLGEFQGEYQVAPGE
jgi:bacterioferritin-associated ferredoxin